MIDQRGRPRIPGPAPANTTKRVLVSTRELRDYDVEPSGDLVEPGRFVIYGWRTNDEDDEGTRLLADTPAQAGKALARLLREGNVMFVVSRLTDDGLVAYPQIAL